MEIEEIKNKGVCLKDSLGVGLARLGADDQCIAFGTLLDLMLFDFGKPLHSLILVGDLHPLEQEMLNMFKI